MLGNLGIKGCVHFLLPYQKVVPLHMALSGAGVYKPCGQMMGEGFTQMTTILNKAIK